MQTAIYSKLICSLKLSRDGNSGELKMQQIMLYDIEYIFSNFTRNIITLFSYNCEYFLIIRFCRIGYVLWVICFHSNNTMKPRACFDKL